MISGVCSDGLLVSELVGLGVSVIIAADGLLESELVGLTIWKCPFDGELQVFVRGVAGVW